MFIRNPKLKKPVVMRKHFFTPWFCEQLKGLLHPTSNTENIMQGVEGKHLNSHTLRCDGQSALEIELAYHLQTVVKTANDNNFLFDPDLTIENEMYINRYAAATSSGQTNDHRGWHVDGVIADDPAYNNRKLSVVVQLSDPSEYEGGQLEFMAYHQPDFDIASQGTVLIFPAFNWHRVTPVTKGARYSAVAFVEGPAFR